MQDNMKISQDLVEFGKGNIDAFVKSTQIWTAGVQAIAKDLAALSQAQLGETVASVKSFATAKSVKEAFELQSAMVRSSVEKAIAEATRMTEASTKLATDAMEPLKARLTLATEKFAKAA